MKVLIAGNSQAGALFRAIKGGLADISNNIDFWFYVIPGGTGPYLEIKADRLKVTSFNKDFPPYLEPEDTDQQRLSSFDAVAVSALGYVDGGFLYDNPIIMQGIVPEFTPLDTAVGQAPISQSCMREIVRNGLLSQQGFMFLGALTQTFLGRVIVQPFPYLSDYLLIREDWKIRELYRDHLGFNRFLSSLRDDIIAEICAECGAELLDYPDPAFSEERFTPRRLMRDSDGVHPKDEYGAMVLAQIEEKLGGSEMLQLEPKSRTGRRKNLIQWVLNQ